MLTSLLTVGTRWTLVGGKGGVGKTTTAAALAVALADQGRRVLALSVDPAHSLGDALEVALGPEPVAVPGVPGLQALEVDAETERRRFLGTRRGELLRLIERGTYLDRDDVEGLVDLAVPGMDELAALLRLAELAADPELALVIDTAPTGHTLRLLELPRLARAWLAALEAMDRKHQIVATALAGVYRADEVTRMLQRLDEELAGVEALLTDPVRTRFALVTNPEPVVLAETARLRDALEQRGVALAGIVVNRSREALSAEAVGAGMAFVAPLHPEPHGVAGVRRFAREAGATPAGAAEHRAAPAPAVTVGAPFRPPAEHRLYLVGGKGGVGKSTTAAALAIHLADGGRRVLLLSTDPAGSLGDVLGVEVGDAATPVAEVERVHARQLDAPAAWERYRQAFRDDAARLFEGVLSGGLSASADQQVVERLVDLAPPGVDELVALLEVVDVAEDRVYDALVLDTAPTGHLLRLLEMPQLAQEWTRALMRLLLKYREVVGLGELAERVVRLARQLRELRGRLADPELTWVLAVALPEGLSVAETERLLAGLRALAMPASGLLVNRALDAGGAVRNDAASAVERLLRLEPGLATAAAPRCEAGPRGAGELRRWLQGWRRVEPAGEEPAQGAGGGA